MLRNMIRRSRVLRIGVPTVLMAAGAVAAVTAGALAAVGFQDSILDRVLAAGELRVITASSPHSYYV